MAKEREIMCRAALARTLTQIPGVDYISISCDGQPLQNDAGIPWEHFPAVTLSTVSRMSMILSGWS